MIEKLMTDFVMWWCKRELIKQRKKHNNDKITIFFISDTDKTDYLMFTDSEIVRKEMEEI